VITPDGYRYNGFDSTVKFDSWNVILTHQSIDPFFTSTTNGYIKSGFLYRAYGVRPGDIWTNVLTAANFLFTTTQNILSTFLEFTTLTGGTIIFDPNTTDDGAVVNSSVSSLDILTGVYNAGYSFVAYPCIVDNNAPLLMNPSPINNARYIPSDYRVSFILYDWQWPWVSAGISPMTNTNNRSHYRYSGGATLLSNYQDAPNSVDNQRWVRSWTIQTTIACPTCTAFGGPYIFTGNDLSIITWTGNTNINQFTRNSKERGYVVSFPAPAPYEIEKLVTLTIVWADNHNELGATHTGTFVLSFNAPQAPTITMNSPTNNATFIDTTINPLLFHFEDDWAWINTGTIAITIPDIYSWGELLYTWYTYSGSDLTISLVHGLPGLWNSGSYQVSFTPQQAFPSNTHIYVTWYVKDLAGNTTTNNRQFTTRPSCSFWWCIDMFQVDIEAGLFSWNYMFSWSLIIITWTNLTSPYPYFTGNNGTILMCWRPYTWTQLTGNIWIYDTLGTIINGTHYTWEELYITWIDGIDFIFSGHTIIVQ